MLHRLGRLTAAAPDVRVLWSLHRSTGRGVVLMFSVAAALALMLAVSPDARFGAPGFAYIRDVGGRGVWAGIWLAAALLLLIGRAVSVRACQWALRANAFLHALWAIGFAVAALAYPAASWLAAVLLASNVLILVSSADSHRVHATVNPALSAAAVALVVTELEQQ